jgi:hypothetical protein
MIIKVKVSGDADLKRKLAQMSATASGAALDTAIKAGAEVIKNAAVEKAPVESGTLRRSIKVTRFSG